MSESRRWRAIERDLRRVSTGDDAAAIDRVMTAVRAAGRPASRFAAVVAWLVRPRFVLAPAHLLAAMTLIVAGAWLLARPSAPRVRDSARDPGLVSSAAVATVVSPRAGADGLHEVRFVFVDDSARRVTVAGDFNDWSPTATPLRRVGNGTLWSAVLRVPPGRHLYAFVVDDTTWVIDATAPRAPETEFGGESSVLFVSRES